MPTSGKFTPANPNSLLTIQDIMAWYKDNPWPLGSIDSYFPLDIALGDTWETIQNQDRLKNEAADPVSKHAPIPVSGREGYKKVLGGFASMGKGREMTSEELEKFEYLKRLFQQVKNPAAAAQLVAFYGNDLAYIRTAIEAQRIYLCWALLSNACSISFSATNSIYFQGITSMDYPVAAWQKDAVATAWSNPAALILDDIKSVATAAEAQGIYYAEIKINSVWFDYVRANTQIKAQTRSLLSVLTSADTNPTLEDINNMLLKYFTGLQIKFVVVDEKITRGALDGTKSTANPFANGVAVFTVGTQVGRFVYKAPFILDASKEALENYFIVGTKWGTDPNYLKNYSKAEAFPVVDTYDENYYLKIDAQAWS